MTGFPYANDRLLICTQLGEGVKINFLIERYGKWVLPNDPRGCQAVVEAFLEAASWRHRLCLSGTFTGMSCIWKISWLSKIRGRGKQCKLCSYNVASLGVRAISAHDGLSTNKCWKEGEKESLLGRETSEASWSVFSVNIRLGSDMTHFRKSTDFRNAKVQALPRNMLWFEWEMPPLGSNTWTLSS